MEILEGDELYRMLLQRYSKNPAGWSFTVSSSRRNGFFDARVSSPEDSWHLKFDTIFKPSPMVLGARTEIDLSRASSSSPTQLSFGFRRVDQRGAPTHLDDSPEGMRRLIAFLGSIEPVAPKEPGNYIQGPFVYTNRGAPAGSMTREQERIDSRLSAEMLKLVRRRYPSYG